MAVKSNVIIYTIGLFAPGELDRNPGVLRKLARQTGGEVYLPQETSELAPICAHIARELRTQYTLAYSPAPETLAGGYHRIQVTVSRPGSGKLTARTRAGYVAPGSEAQQAGSSRP
jgi:VWFA-related protein